MKSASKSVKTPGTISPGSKGVTVIFETGVRYM